MDKTELLEDKMLNNLHHQFCRIEEFKAGDYLIGINFSYRM